MTKLGTHIQAGRMALLLSVAGLPLNVYAQDEAAQPAAATMPVGPSFDVAGMIGSLLFVILCIVGLMWIFRRTRLVGATGQSGVSLVSQIPLSMKEKLLVVQVGDEKLLLGCTSTSINTLHTWASAADDSNAKVPESAFAKLMAKRQVVTKPSRSSRDGEQQ